MPTSSGRLIEFLAANPLPWLRYDSERGKFIMVVDNHLMSTYRACPQHFVNAHVLGLRRKSEFGGGLSRNWYLEYGIALHEVLERYYKEFRKPGFEMVEFVKSYAAAMWIEHKLDEFAEHKEFKLTGGALGFMGLIAQYATIMSPQNEKLRVLGTEVSFGKNLEVLLHADEYFEVYLSGRMDIIVDDGYFICPMDHKTMGTFRNNPGDRFATDEGPTGYIYALSTILPAIVPEELILKRDCTKILMNLISKAPTPAPQDRFKRIVLRKTSWKLEQYRVRMAVTAQHMLNDMEQIAANSLIYRNTFMCDNWMHFGCTYKDICRQESKDGELVTIQNGFIKSKLWDTETVGTSV